MDIFRPSPAKVLAIAFLMLVLFSVPSAQGTPPNDSPDLFSDSTAQGDALYLHDSAIVRTRHVNVNFSLLGDQQTPSKTLRLNLFDDVSLNATFERLDGVDAHGYIWVGQVEGVPMSNVTLVAKDGLMQGQISMPGGIYRIGYAGNNIHAITQVNQAVLPPEADPIPVNLPQPTFPNSTAATTWTFFPFVSKSEPVSGPIIDLLVVYTPAARVAQGGTTAMNNQVDLAVSLSNTSYQNSGMNQRIRLVNKAETSYTESSDMGTDLYRVTSISGYTGYMSDVRAMRETYKADLVNLLVQYPSTYAYCGIAWMMSSVSVSFALYGYSVVGAGSCATSNYSFAHEMGHNMGARHDWYVDSNTTPYPYAHGYVNLTGRWRTVMAYNNYCAANGFNCTRLLYWSNPDITYGGAPMGVAEGQPQAADNRKALNNTAPTVSAFR